MQKSNTCTSDSLIILIIFLTFSTICDSQIHAASVDKSGIPQTINELKIKVDSLLQKYKIPGIGIALVSKDSILWTGVSGVVNVETSEPVTVNTLFRVGSCTKSFLGLGFLKLVEEGKINLNTPVSKIAPEIEINNPWKETDPVRIVHLIEHTAGFDDIHANSLNNQENPAMPLKQALDLKASARIVRWKPGTRYSYSSPGYTLAGYILEKVTGKKFEDYIKEAILETIGMKTSIFRLTDENKHLLSAGYINDYEPIPFFEGYDRPSSSLIASTREMALFVQFLLNSGKASENQIISEVFFDKIGKPTTTVASRAGLKNGYSFGIGVRFQGGFKWYGHSGGGPGCIAKYSYLKEAGLGYAIMANKFSVAEFGKISKLIQDYLIRNISAPPQSFVNVSADQLKKYVGYYEARSPRQQLTEFVDILAGGTTISFENDTLYQQDFLASKKALIPVSLNMFRSPGEPEASSIFTVTPESGAVFATIRYYYEKTGAWKPVVYRILVFGALIIMFSAVIYAFSWVPIHLYKKLMKKEKHFSYLRMRVIPLLTVLSLVFGIIVVSNQSLVTIGQMTPSNIIFFISTLLFAGLSILSLVISFISFKKPVGKITSIYAVILSLSCFGMTLYLGYWGIIGLRIWAY
jgi:CubicO group peptidase (beta-lactamase class C family)